MSQLTRIEAILRAEGKIDNFRAIHERISLRLGARIQDLEDKGWTFRTEHLPNKNYVYHVVSEPPKKMAVGLGPWAD